MKILEEIERNNNQLFIQSFALLLRAYKGCAKLKDSFAKLQAKWIEITQDILTKNTKYCENSLYSQHKVRIVGNMFLHTMFDRF